MLLRTISDILAAENGKERKIGFEHIQMVAYIF